MSFFEELPDVLWDTVKDSSLIFPFMFAAFIVIGLLERGAGRKMVSVILAADRIGPLAGGLLGVVPSCGFSAAASNLFGAGLLTTGTLLSVYISTSDEMLAIMVSERTNIGLILKILAIKAGCGIVFGFLADGAMRLYYAAKQKKSLAAVSAENSEIDEESAVDEACACGCSDGCCAVEGNLFVSALKRSFRIFLFVFAASLLINILFVFVSPASVGGFMSKYPFLGCVVAAVLGLIPNCAVSVALTQLYLGGVIGASALLAGLMTGAGSGLLVLFRTNADKKENAVTVALLLLGGLLMGWLCGALFF